MQSIATAAGVLVAAAVTAGFVMPVTAAKPLSADDIRTRFANGGEIKGTTIPGGSPYDLRLSADGAATLRFLTGDHTLRTGTWRSAPRGYCATFGGSERCYEVVRNGRAFDLLDDAGKVVARWTS